MKLRTKMILLSSGAVMAAMLLSNFAIWLICARVLHQDAVQNAYYESAQLAQDFAAYAGLFQEPPDEKACEYFFKNRKDDKTVCVLYAGTKNAVYNKTVFSLQELQAFSYQNYKTAADGSAQYAVLHHRGTRYTVVRNEFTVSTISCTLYHFADSSAVTRRLQLLTLGMTGVSAAAVGAAVVLVLFGMRRAFLPLKNLSETAESIAAGFYNKRVAVDSQDEIGALAGDFNKMADAVERQIEQMQESERKKTVFMGDLTHELKTPLTAISGYAQTLRRVRLSREEEEEALDYIDRECKRLERLSKKMMRLLELDGTAELTFTAYPVAELFAAAVKSCRAKAAEKNMAIQIQSQEGELWADFDLMTDVLVNLLDNGIQASPDNARILLYSEKTDHTLRLTVEDFGCGIPEAEQKKITEPFYMIDKSRSRRSGGAGLGLALTSLIVRRHHMTLEIQSEVGKGTKMTVVSLDGPTPEPPSEVLS